MTATLIFRKSTSDAILLNHRENPLFQEDINEKTIKPQEGITMKEKMINENNLFTNCFFDTS